LCLPPRAGLAARAPAASCVGSAAHRVLHSFPTRRSSDLGLAVLAELGLLTWEEEGGRLRVHLAPPPGRKLDLNGSVRYTKGIRSKRVAAAISEIALSGGLARVQDLLRGGAGPWT